MQRRTCCLPEGSGGKWIATALANILIAVAVICFFLWQNHSAKGSRVLPEKKTTGPLLIHVSMQREIYDEYKKAGLWGSRVVHLNRFMNLVDYFPPEETVSTSFPIRAGDVRPLYEKGLDSHNWLFIANRTGMVRTADIVLPDSVLNGRLAAFAADFAYRISGNSVKGYTYDMPVMVTTLDSLPVMDEPVILNVDAGYFVRPEDYAGISARLREKCPDIRMVVFSESRDEPGISNESRRQLADFEKSWR